MTIPQWSPGTIYNPGDIVLPRSQNIVTQQQPNDNSFEDATLAHWTLTVDAGTTGTIASAGDRVFSGTLAIKYIGGTGTGLRNSGTAYATNDLFAAVIPGQIINFGCYINRTGIGNNGNLAVVDGGPRINWYDATHTFISSSFASTYPGAVPGSTPQGMVGGSAPADQWLQATGQGVAPAGAAYAKAVVALRVNNQSGNAVWADLFTWDYTFQGLPAGLSYVAVQPAAGTSAAKEPVWPVTSGLTVVDNTVTWQAEFASRITWTASALMKSGNSEPVWPSIVGAHVIDNAGSGYDISWVAVDGRVTDPNCPQSTVVAIAQGKVFAANSDIIPFSATTNPLDWTTKNDAGYLPFGMQTFGNEPVAGLGLYRGNLVATNSLGYQLWQVDPDPANMALLDAQPVGSTFPKSIMPVQNDLVLLTQKGIRSLAIAGQSGNMQAGQFGKNIDPLVIASIAGGLTPRGLFYPGTGQYWLCFGSTIYVMTNNGAKANSWSQYGLPGSVDAWTVLNGILYLRSGDLVWQVDEATLLDDSGGANTAFPGIVWWPFIDLGSIGKDKVLEGMDLVCTGSGKINILYNENDFTQMTADYAFTGDTLPNMGMLPFPLTSPSFSVKLTFDGVQTNGAPWEWQVTTLYENKTQNT